MMRLIQRLFVIFIVCALAGTGLLCYARYAEPNMLGKTYTDVSVSHLNISEEKSLKIFLFGDTHLGFSYSLEDFEKVIKACQEENPDIIVFTGDLIDDIKKYDADFESISVAMNKLQAPLGKYAVLGNHDYGSNGSRTYIDIMSSGGFEVLVNEHVLIEEYNIVIFGIDDCLIGHGNPDILAAASPDTCNIALCHEPDIADEISDYNVSLMLAGHTHGGQVYLPFYTKQFLPPYGEKYVRGLYEIGGTGFPLYVTKGIGTTNLPLRLFSKPEISIINLSLADEQ